MNRAMTFVDPALMINYDATGFAVGYDSKRKVQVSYAKSERNKKKSLKTTPTKDEKGGISKLIIKFFLLINAIGDQDAPTYIIADPNMHEDDIIVFKLPILAISVGLGSYGYVVFMKSTSGNVEFWTWLNRTLVYEFITTLRTHYALNSESTVWMQVGGEPTQIECYREDYVRNFMISNNVVLGKPPASTTKVT